jgi:hypothetical protein
MRTVAQPLMCVSVVTLLMAVAAPARAQDTVPHTIAESTARRIALDHVHGGTVRSVHLDARTGHPLYNYDLAERGRANDVVVRVDATDGHVLDIVPIRTHADSAAEADVRQESVLKDTAAMPPGALKDTTAGHAHDSSSSRPPPH